MSPEDQVGGEEQGLCDVAHDHRCSKIVKVCPVLTDTVEKVSA